MTNGNGLSLPLPSLGVFSGKIQMQEVSQWSLIRRNMSASVVSKSLNIY